MRLFIAIELPPDVRGHLQRMQERLQPLLGGKWTRPEQLHLTLKFLGETPDEQLPQILRALQAVQTSEPIRLQTAGPVYFPRHGPIRIVAAALSDAAEQCALLQQQVDEACHAAGFRLEGRQWTPHITLARLKQSPPAAARDQAAALMAAFPAGVAFEPDEIALMESRLDRHGPTYTRLAHIPFRA